MSLPEYFQALDEKLLALIHVGAQNPVFDALMPALSFLGNWGLIWLLAAAAFLCTKKYRRTGFVLLGTLLICTLAGNSVIKPLVGRLRPCQADLAAPLLIARPEDFSFPSGHAASSFGAAACILRADRRLGAAALALAALIAFSRLYLYVHYPSDVLAGALLGVLAAAAAAELGKLADKIIRRAGGQTKR